MAELKAAIMKNVMIAIPEMVMVVVQTAREKVPIKLEEGPVKMILSAEECLPLSWFVKVTRHKLTSVLLGLEDANV